MARVGGSRYHLHNPHPHCYTIIILEYHCVHLTSCYEIPLSCLLISCKCFSYKMTPPCLPNPSSHHSTCPVLQPTGPFIAPYTSPVLFCLHAFFHTVATTRHASPPPYPSLKILPTVQYPSQMPLWLLSCSWSIAVFLARVGLGRGFHSPSHLNVSRACSSLFDNFIIHLPDSIFSLFQTIFYGATWGIFLKKELIVVPLPKIC